VVGAKGHLPDLKVLACPATASTCGSSRLQVGQVATSQISFGKLACSRLTAISGQRRSPSWSRRAWMTAWTSRCIDTAVGVMVASE
jgi:hypothetical protein